MKNVRRKGSDPDYINLTLSEPSNRAPREPVPTIVAPGRLPECDTTGGGVSAADLISHFYATDVPSSPVAQDQAPAGAPDAQPSGRPDPARTEIAGAADAAVAGAEREDGGAGDEDDSATLPQSTDWLSLDEVAELLDTGRRAVLEHIVRKKLVAVRSQRGDFLVRCDSARRLIEGGDEEITAGLEDGPDFELDAGPIAGVAEPAEPEHCRAWVDIRDLLSRLETTQQQLEAAHYKTGLLESELQNQQEKVRTLPDAQTILTRLTALELENQDLRRHVIALERRQGPWTRLWALLTGGCAPRRSAIKDPAFQPDLDYLYPRRPRRQFFPADFHGAP